MQEETGKGSIWILPALGAAMMLRAGIGTITGGPAFLWHAGGWRCAVRGAPL